MRTSTKEMDMKLHKDASGSWVATCIASGEVFEFFTRRNAQKALESGYFTVETALQYLSRINKEIKESGK